MTENLLFTPITLPNGTTIKNRFFKSAMSEGMGTRDFQPKKNIATLYKRWAEGGTGLIITGNIMVDPKGTAEPGNIVFDKNSNIEILKDWAKQGQQHGAKVMVQLNHPGKQVPKTIAKETVAPSTIPLGNGLNKLFSTPRALTTSKVEELVQKFVTSAKVAKEAGFSGVQIHAAHGYLISQFLSPHDNRRTDKYGGSLENRMRFLKEIYLGMREELGKDFTIGIKINSTDFKEDGLTEEDSLKTIIELANLGLDFVEISGGTYERPAMMGATSKSTNQVFFAEYSKKLKQKIEIPVVVTGGIRSINAMNTLLNDNTTDFIGIARPLTIDPNIPNKIKQGTYTIVETTRVSTGVKKLDKIFGSLLGIVYYQVLMQNIAKGKEPKATKNAWPSLIQAVYNQGLAVLFPQRAK
ncbi:NADH:flavin oxidoreductase/NADH oxidase family protein [Gemella morbillorum]|uniref:NADH:flavin oxidoreductase/NADH oxidase family protein n=1 Tax=Gemella morbillorum TaxID=29391 RepID=UPI0025514676|nr:NADH:flavin oxidoreductase/NADH oxidase family protein [Gemella morbillorum]MDK8240144.1 NADH:flavin oxidoreductase/NADH oxidase family protein [Gemella morbillorum]MDK8254633.1 NADH:flavin oxidoreductase/NADH oxidase family protein [Gemella morbillorum]